MNTESHTLTCKNCSLEFEGNFCGNCGQKASVKRFTIKSILHDLPHTIFHIDKGILKNITGIRHPKTTVYEYISGKRANYFNPLLFFVITAGLVLYVEHLSDFKAHFVFVFLWGGKLYNVGAVIIQFVKYIYLFSAFFVSIPTYFLFKKETRFNYAEQVIANIFIMGYVNIIYLLLTLVPFYKLFPSHIFVNTFPMNLSVLILFYFFSGLVFSSAKRPFLGWVKSLVALIFQLVLFYFFIWIIAMMTVAQHNL